MVSRQLYLTIAGLSILLLVIFDAFIYLNRDYFGANSAITNSICWAIIFLAIAIYCLYKYMKLKK